MKKYIHPKYVPAEITCACGNVIKTGGTVSKMRVEICSACHPFYTGDKKLIDTAGRVDRFKQILEKKKKHLAAIKKKKHKKVSPRTKRFEDHNILNKSFKKSIRPHPKKSGFSSIGVKS